MKYLSFYVCLFDQSFKLKSIVLIYSTIILEVALYSTQLLYSFCISTCFGIRARICHPNPFLVLKVDLVGTVLRIRSHILAEVLSIQRKTPINQSIGRGIRNVNLCHNKCGAMKTPPCSKFNGAKHRFTHLPESRVSDSLARANQKPLTREDEVHRQWSRLHMSQIPQQKRIKVYTSSKLWYYGTLIYYGKTMIPRGKTMVVQ